MNIERPLAVVVITAAVGFAASILFLDLEDHYRGLGLYALLKPFPPFALLAASLGIPFVAAFNVGASKYKTAIAAVATFLIMIPDLLVALMIFGFFGVKPGRPVAFLFVLIQLAVIWVPWVFSVTKNPPDGCLVFHGIDIGSRWACPRCSATVPPDRGVCSCGYCPGLDGP